MSMRSVPEASAHDLLPADRPTCMADVSYWLAGKQLPEVKSDTLVPSLATKCSHIIAEDSGWEAGALRALPLPVASRHPGLHHGNLEATRTLDPNVLDEDLHFSLLRTTISKLEASGKALCSCLSPESRKIDIDIHAAGFHLAAAIDNAFILVRQD